ncbi:hypothetical protein DPV78_000148 [Talaromyces pinophilus]|nr:hypothetical protein DPV78_000148 [Talaromyces pinophilus]
MPDIDFLINIIRKTKKTQLINRLIKNRYIYKNNATQDSTGIYSGHLMLSDHSTIFQKNISEDYITSSSM